MSSKKKIRLGIRQQRQALSEVQQRDAGADVLTQLRKIPFFIRANKISVYLANDGELPLDYIVDFCWIRNKFCYLPVLFGKNTRRMHFAPFAADSSLVMNSYGIPEPDVKIKNQLKPQQLDLILLPLVAFDANGNRLGMGGGFYDKTFEFLRRRKIWRKPKLVGVAYDFQQVENLPTDKWDVPLDYIVTETRIIKIAR